MKTRAAAVLAAILLGLSTLAATPAAAASTTGATYVAVGDSIAAGNGLLPYLDEGCLRSTRSYPELLAKDLGVAVVSAACSGATTGDVMGQVEKLARSGDLGPATELVTLTVGINDTAWRDALIVCSNAPLPDAPPCDAALALVEQMIAAGLSERIAAVIALIHASAPNAQIVVTGYPLPFGDTDRTCRLGVLGPQLPGAHAPLSFDAIATAAINDTAGTLNDAIATAVGSSDVADAQYVDVNAEGFDGHGLCDSGSRWMTGFLPVTARTAEGSFHPNAAGQTGYAEIIAAALGG
ncbi:SGNH/GDSL hydrolase family protein [Microbacterium oryzae]|nr:SGNH/GDSL hydrolase family protein [Microbacterium oryzae]